MNLENNSKEMKTVVETFVMEETVDLTYDDVKLEKWNELRKELGLVGQEAIQAPTKSPIPFMYMNQTYVDVAGTLCPRKENVVDYNATPIPLEILELIAMSSREQYFTNVEIWYDEKSKDPFAIGILKEFYIKVKSSWSNHEDKKRFKNRTDCDTYIKEMGYEDAEAQESYSDTKYYCIGKWADVKQSWKQLTAKAKKRFIEEGSNRFKTAIRDAERGLADIKLDAETKFGV